MPTFHRLRIAAIDRLTPKAVQLQFEIPSELQGVFHFYAGQYITLKADIQGADVRRAYSICSSPEDGVLSVGVKEVPQGIFSTFVNQQLQVGDQLEVAEPEGRFLFKKEGAKDSVLAIAAGSGITPILSIAKTALAGGTPVILVFGNKTVEDTMFAETLAELKQQYPDHFTLHSMYSQEAVEGSRFGRIDNGFLRWVLNQHSGETIGAAYLCGPEPLIELSKQTLNDSGFGEDQIHFELFTSSSSSDEAGDPVEVADGKIQYAVVLDGETHEFTADAKPLVLDAVLAENIDAPYSCQGGICSSCIAKVTEGKAEMVKNQILTDGEVAEGLILTCQAHATSSKITLDYDDV